MTEQTRFFDVDCSFEFMKTNSNGVTIYYGWCEGCKAENQGALQVFNGKFNINDNERDIHTNLDAAYFSRIWYAKGMELQIKEDQLKEDNGYIDSIDMIVSPYSEWLAQRRRWRLTIVPKSSECRSKYCSQNATAEILRPMQEINIRTTYANLTFNEQTKRSVYYVNFVASTDTTGKSNHGVFVLTRVSDTADNLSVFDVTVTIEKDIYSWSYYIITL
ncbi:Hypothetical predicted protein [Mytilus galloprovincialis]|uniref:Uncharacterized protein n=1 Tax=Mytilus galloprovincialis TaxID=29158 RepID=A0A8B6GVT6_MYTGA|nr:Hypothetical predicted protein [Mytilus galloprovincialis]